MYNIFDIPKRYLAKALLRAFQAKSQKHIRPQGDFSGQCFSDEYFGRLIATGEWGVCLLFSCKLCYPQNKNMFSKIFKG